MFSRRFWIATRVLQELQWPGKFFRGMYRNTKLNAWWRELMEHKQVGLLLTQRYSAHTALLVKQFSTCRLV